MRIKEYRFWLCLTGTLLLTAGVVFLPRYISRSMDLGHLYQVEISNREDFSFLEQGSNNIYDVVRAFEHLKQGEEGPVLLTTINEPIQISSELLEEIYQQAMLAAEYGMLPWPFYDEIVAETDGTVLEGASGWASFVKSAQYYTLTFESEENPKKKELLNFWYIRFSDEQSFDYYFIVNAVNYQIYYAEIHNAFSQRLMEEAMVYSYETDMPESVNPFGEIFAGGCAQYYECPDYDYVGQRNLYRKLSLCILYFENEEPVYIEHSVVESDASWKYDGICVGFQDLVRWVRRLRDSQ